MKIHAKTDEIKRVIILSQKSQTAIAKELKIERTNFNKIINKSNHASMKTALKIAEYFEKDFDDLFEIK